MMDGWDYAFLGIVIGSNVLNFAALIHQRRKLKERAVLLDHIQIGIARIEQMHADILATDRLLAPVLIGLLSDLNAKPESRVIIQRWLDARRATGVPAY